MLIGSLRRGRLAILVAFTTLAVAGASTSARADDPPGALDTSSGLQLDALAAAPVTDKVRVWQIEFDTPDVVRDRKGADPQRIDQFDEGCPTSKDQIEWKDCKPDFPDGTTEKDWPIVAKRNTKLKIKQVRFKVQNHAAIAGATIVGTADLGGGLTITFTQAGIDQTGSELVADNLVADKPLPDNVTHFNNMTIRWTITAGAETFDAGSSDVPVYVVYAVPKSVLFLTLVDLTSRAADGQSTEATVVGGIWPQFQGRDIHRRDLNPVNGAVATNAGDNSALLQYWTPWTLLNDYIFLGGPLTCPANFQTAVILKSLIGRCGGWSQFFKDTLGVQGIGATPQAVDDYPGFPTGPAGTKIMLIKNWTFVAAPKGMGDFPFLTEILIYDSGPRGYGMTRDVDDAPGVPGQGEAVVPNPPGWFSLGDHAVDTYNGKIYDPSYGTGPFDNITKWAEASLAGFAFLTKSHHAAVPGNPAHTTWIIHAHKGIT